MGRSVATVASVVLVASGCQSAPPSPTHSATPSVVATETPGEGSPGVAELARGCWGIREPDCGRAVGAAFDALADFEAHSYGYASVDFSECPQNGCPDVFIPGVIVRVLLEPRSDPAPLDEPFPFTLGHCGIWSGIDADGSFWDPIGLIDRENPHTINSAMGVMVISSEENATLQTAMLRLELVRHQGLKSIPPCA